MFAIILIVSSLLLIANKISPITGIGLKDPNTRWPQNIVPYEIDIEKYKESDIERIRESMKKIESKTCIRFVEHTDEQNYIKIHEDEKHTCASEVGMANHGMQDVFLSTPGCMHLHNIIHELLHTLGLENMHQAKDRDNFVDIDFNNILPNKLKYFKKRGAKKYSYFGVPYDPASIMHYGGFEYAIDTSKRTIQGKYPEVDRKMGAKHLSKGDITRINNMYNCPAQ